MSIELPSRCAGSFGGIKPGPRPVEVADRSIGAGAQRRGESSVRRQSLWFCLFVFGAAAGCGGDPVTPSPAQSAGAGGASNVSSRGAAGGDSGFNAGGGVAGEASDGSAGDGGGPGLDAGGVDAPRPTFEFTVSPIAPANVQSLAPLGHLNPPAHTFPTDHIYVFHHVGRESDPPYEVFAPADGTVIMVQREADDAIYIAATTVHTYYLGHMLVDPAIAANQHVTAGQHLGTTGPVSHAIDVGVLNATVENAFINPDRYSGNSRHAEPPFRYLSPELKAMLGPLVETTPENREGVFVFDKAGMLGGNWFHRTLAISQSVGPAAGPKLVAFVRDTVDPSRRMVSLGGTVGLAGIYAMDAGDPDPASITPSSGAVTLHLSNMQQGTTGVPMVVTMMDASTVRIQFQGNDETYTR